MLLLLAALGCQQDPSDTGKDAPDTDTDVEDTSPDSWPVPEDADEDGVTPNDGDCDDTNADIHPGRAEDCNGVDDNCVNGVDEGFADVDGDGSADCQDVEDCDGLDNDGDGEVDEGSPDTDVDGTADCVEAEECDGVDNDGDGQADEGFDADGDGFTACVECDDEDASVHPGADDGEDGLDNDCDGVTDEGAWNVGDLVLTEVMTNPQDHLDSEGEWIEVYNASDRDLDLNGLTLVSGGATHLVDAGGALTVAPGEHFVLGAGDLAWVGYTWTDISLSNEEDELSVQVDGLELDALSWDDGVTMPDPLGASIMVDPWFIDVQANDDTAAWCAATLPWSDTDAGSPGTGNEPCTTVDHDFDGVAVSAGDCDDADPTVAPGLADTWYDGVDTDCDAWSDFDADLDGHDATAFGGRDCDDADASANPDAAEVCDDLNVDEDCSGLADDLDSTATGQSTWYRDADSDGYGDDTNDTDACDQPTGYVAVSEDCDDGSGTVNPAAEDVCGNGIDDDCDDGPSGCGPSGSFDAEYADAILTGETANDQAASGLAFSDLDGDGASDLIVGAYVADGSSRTDAGVTYLFTGLPSGTASLATADARLIGASASDGAGYAVSGAGGDFDGDGVNDLIVGAIYLDSGGSNAGGAYIVSGDVTGDVDLGTITDVLVGEDPSDMAGASVRGLGDTDGDGLTEVMVSANGDDSGGSNAGIAYLVDGGSTGTFDLSGASGRIVGEDPSDAAGVYTAVGDIDGDGIYDLMVGACGDDTGGSDGGAVYVVYLPVSGTLDLSNADAKLYAEGLSDNACHPRVLGDVDGDGATDMAVGADSARVARIRPGVTYLLLEQPSGSYDLGNAVARIVGASDTDMEGYAVSSGDVDGDGFVDLISGAYATAGSGSESGAVYVHMGPVGSGDIDVADADAIITGGTSDRFGLNLAAGGDVDADGYADILSSAPYDSTGAARAGSVYLILGGTGY